MSKFEQLYHAHKRLVFNLALQYVQCVEDAEEIAQDVFLAVHQSIDSFHQHAKLTTWLYRITINKSLDFIKAKKRKKRFGIFTSIFFENSNDIKHERPTFDHPGVQLESKEALEIIFLHLNQLPDKQKTALILSKIEQKPQAEIAEIMDLSVKAVESLLQRAKKNLLHKLSGSEG